MYLLADRQLRRKGLDTTHRWIGLPPLASMEKFTQWMIYGGFPLLSISTLAGILQMAHAHAGLAPAAPPTQHTKIILGVVSWLVYAVLIHVPFNPSFRGRRAAWLAVEVWEKWRRTVRGVRGGAQSKELSLFPSGRPAGRGS